MTKSSALSELCRPVLEAFAVSEERSDHVDAGSSQGEDSVLVVLSFSAFSGVVNPRGRTVHSRGLGREVAGSQQSSVVAPGSTVIVADSARVTRRRGKPQRRRQVGWNTRSGLWFRRARQRILR
jgi:hypothetical protein